MSVRNSGISPRARLTIAAVSMGAVALVVFLVLAFGSRIGGSIAASPNSQVADGIIPASTDARSPEEARKDALNKVSGLPLYFEANRGQVDPSVHYLARSGRYSLFLTDDAAVFSLIGGEFHKGPMPAGFPYKAGGETNLTESAVRVRLVGASPHPQVEGLEPLPGRVNYLIGAEKNWHRDIPTFGRVRFHNVYPGVDVVYYGSPSALEYDFIAAPGADTSKIKFAIEGPAQTTQTASGDIVIATTSGVIRIDKPQNYQQNADGSRTPVAGSFTLAKDSTLAAGVPTRQVEFQLASYDRNRTLFIDPVVNTIPYSTYFGGQRLEHRAAEPRAILVIPGQGDPDGLRNWSRRRARSFRQRIHHRHCVLEQSSNRGFFPVDAQWAPMLRQIKIRTSSSRSSTPALPKPRR